MRRKDPKEFEQEVYELTKDEYTLMEDYYLSSVPLEMRHNTCNNTFPIRPNAFLKGGRCPYCNGNRAKQKTTEQFKKEVYDLVGDEYTVLGEYTNRSTNIKIRHNHCQREYHVEPGNFLYKSRCVECYYDDLRLSEDEVEERIKDALGEDYILVSDYESLQKKVTMQHTACGHLFEVRLTDVFYKRSGCKCCTQSRGEEYVMNYLDSKNIKYVIQKGFDNLRDKAPLTYDFFLPEHGILIEYQGEQHFHPKTFGGISKAKAKENLSGQQRRDRLKREYASENGYTLMEPTYKLKTYSSLVKYLDENLHC